MTRYLCTLFSLLILLGGCAGYSDSNRQLMQSLPMRYSQFDVDLAWQVKQIGSETFVEGQLKSLRYQYMSDIEVWVAVLDAGGKPVARSVSLVAPHELRINEVAPFNLRLPVLAPSGTMLRFTYKYSGTDGGGGPGDFRVQSFNAVIP